MNFKVVETQYSIIIIIIQRLRIIKYGNTVKMDLI